jgi:hypothetical protein
MAIILNDNIDTRAPKPSDNRYGPYASTAAALASIPAYQRYVGLTVGVGNPIAEWWFDNSLTLVLKTSSGTVTGITAGTGIAVTGTSTNPTISVITPTQLTTNISTNVIADQASDTKYPSVKAVKTYVDANVAGLLDDRGNFAANPTSPGNYPQPPLGSGPAGAIMKGDIWFISVPGFLNTNAVMIGSSVRALVDNATALNDAQWDILDTGLGFIPEDVNNKVTSGSSITAAPNNATLYPSLKALTEYLATVIPVIPSTPTLQQVTNAGATSTNNITVNGLTLGSLGSGLDFTGNTNQLAIRNVGTSDNLLEINYGNTGSLKWGGGTYPYVEISNSTVGNVNLTAPGNSGTIPISVNGNVADTFGAITIPVGTVTSVAALTLGTSGTDLNSTVANGTTTPVITLNVPDASLSARGVVTTGTQTFGGSKTFRDNIFIQKTSSTSQNITIGFGGGVADYDNLAFGSLVLNSSTANAFSNLGVGHYSLQKITNGNNNIGLGNYTLNSLINGQDNTSIGYSALQKSTGSSNTVIGNYAGSDLVTGNNNTLIGASVINSTTSGSNNTIIGKITGLGASLSDNVIIADGSGNIRFRDNNTSTILPRLAGTGTRMVVAGSNGELATQTIPSGTVTGTGTLNYVSKWSASTGLTNSSIVDDGTSVGIGTATPSASAKVQIDSTTQGFLPPRMTQAQRLAIVSPAEGLIVYDTTNSALGVYSGGGWRKLSMQSF